jgi:hypothetical protein
MTIGSNDCVAHHRSERRARGFSALTTRVLAATLAASLCLMPVRAAFADQVLEVPSSAESTPPRAVASTVAETSPRPTHRQALAPVPKDLGTLQDYERETESDASASPRMGGAPGLASAPMNQRFEASRNRDMMAQNAMLGVLMIGLFAMEMSQPHHHRHH